MQRTARAAITQQTLHPARLPAARVHTLLRLRSCHAYPTNCLSFQRVRSSERLLHTWLHASGDPCSPSTGCCLALPTQAAQPVPRGTCSHSAPSLSASLEDTLDPACSVISALLYTLLCAPRPIHRLLSCRAHVAPTQLPVHSLKHFPPLC